MRLNIILEEVFKDHCHGKTFNNFFSRTSLEKLICKVERPSVPSHELINLNYNESKLFYIILHEFNLKVLIYTDNS